MALRYIDSMGDHYTAAQALLKWTSTSGLITRVPGVHGYALSGGLSKGMSFGSTTLIMEVYIRRLGNASTIFSISDNGMALVGSVQQQINCSFNVNGALKVDQWAGSAPLAITGPDLVRVGTWYHFGWKVFLHATAGTVEVRLNGGTVINLTGVRTVSGLNPPANYWSGTIGAFSVGDNAAACQFDDLVVMDDAADGIDDPRLGGGGFDGFLGPVEIKVKRPNAPGLLAEWTPSPTPPNWENVNDIESDDDTTVNIAAPTAVGASDLFAMENLLPGEDVVAVQSLVLARNTDAGVAAAAVLTHAGGVTTAGPTVYQASTYSYMIRPEPTRPDGTLWTASAWDAIQYGYRRIV